MQQEAFKRRQDVRKEVHDDDGVLLLLYIHVSKFRVTAEELTKRATTDGRHPFLWLENALKPRAPAIPDHSLFVLNHIAKNSEQHDYAEWNCTCRHQAIDEPR